jgi:hypothetical protein
LEWGEVELLAEADVEQEPFISWADVGQEPFIDGPGRATAESRSVLSAWCMKHVVVIDKTFGFADSSVSQWLCRRLVYKTVGSLAPCSGVSLSFCKLSVVIDVEMSSWLSTLLEFQVGRHCRLYVRCCEFG